MHALLLCLSLAAPIKVAVPGLEAQGVAPELAKNLDGVIMTHLGDVPEVVVVSLADFQQLITQEQRRQMVGCAEEKSCVADLPGGLDADRLLWGTLGKVGERYVVTLAIVDTQSHAVLRRVTREATTAETLLAAAAEATDALWKDTTLPLSGCVDCGGGTRTIHVALMFGNNFTSLFSSGLDVSLLGPGTKLDVAYRAWSDVSLFFGTGLSFGSSDKAGADDDVSFQVVPVNLGARYHFDHLTAALNGYAGLGLGVGFVRTAFADAKKISSTFAAEAGAGVEWLAIGDLGVLVEASYQLNLKTPSALRSQPLGALAVRLGVGYGF